MGQALGCVCSAMREFGLNNSMSDMSMAMKPVTFSESGGIRYLHFGSELIQGAMRIRDPDEIYLEYNQQMMAWLLFLETKPGMRIAQLGLGTGALTKFTHCYCPAVKTTVVELNPAVIVSARSMFFTPSDDRRLETLQADARAFVKNTKYQNHFDAVQVDLYDAICDGPSASSLDFYKGCYNTYCIMLTEKYTHLGHLFWVSSITIHRWKHYTYKTSLKGNASYPYSEIKYLYIESNDVS